MTCNGSNYWRCLTSGARCLGAYTMRAIVRDFDMRDLYARIRSDSTRRTNGQ